METGTILTIFGAIGGAETVKWIISYMSNRKQTRRLKDAEAAAAELEVRKDQVDWLETRLAHRDARIDALNVELRKEQAEKLQIIYEKHEIELKLKEAEMRRCNVHGCTNRQPPSEY